MSQDKTNILGGLFEVCIGVVNADDAISHWERFGYRQGPSGSLTAKEALDLYGVDSELTSHRLLHQNSDHGLIRLMAWKKPSGPGLNMAPLRTIGVRWSVQKTEDMMVLLNHAEVLEAQGKPLNWLPPILNASIHGTQPITPKPFRDPIVCLREFQIFRPLYQQIFTKRYNLELPLYGQINHNSMFRCSQIIHAGMLCKEKDISVFDFYDKVLGLKRLAQADFSYTPNHIATKMFDLYPGDSFTMMDFDDVRSEAHFDRQISGRLRVFNINSKRKEKNMHQQSKPGNLGYSLYTYRTDNAEAMHNKISNFVSHSPSQIIKDEFGNKAFSFVSPDGYCWTLVET